MTTALICQPAAPRAVHLGSILAVPSLSLCSRSRRSTLEKRNDCSSKRWAPPTGKSFRFLRVCERGRCLTVASLLPCCCFACHAHGRIGINFPVTITVDGRKFASVFIFLIFANRVSNFDVPPRPPRFNVDAFQVPSPKWKKVRQLHLMPSYLTTLRWGGAGGMDPQGVVQSGSARTYSHINSLANFFPSTVYMIDIYHLSWVHQAMPRAES